MTRARDLASMLHSDGSLNISTSVNLGDNEKAYFGDANDLVIFHNASKSIIEDVGTGNLEVRGTNIEFLDGTGSEYYLTMANNGSVGLYWDGNLKLSTTSTGVDVSGTVTADGLTVDGTTATIQDDSANLRFENSAGTRTGYIQNRTSAFEVWNDQATPMSFGTNNIERMRITSAGNVGIGTSSPTGILEINGSNNALFAMRTTGDTDSQVMGTQYLNNSGAVTAQTFATGNSTSSSVFRIKAIGSIDLIGGDVGVTAAGPHLRIDSSGNVGIGTSSPSTYGQLAVYKASGDVEAAVVTGSANYATYRVQNNAQRYSMQIRTDQSNAFVIRDETAGGNRFLISTGGNVGIGTSSPTNGKLEVTHSSSTVPAGFFRNTSGSGNSPSLTVQGGAHNAAPNFSVLDYSGNTDFVVQGTGNVGIGTASPQNLVQIEGSSGTVPSQLRLGVTASGQYYDIGRDYTDGLMTFYSGQASPYSGYKWSVNAGTQAMKIDASGRVTMPAQPAFSVYPTASTSPGNTISFGGSDFNTGGHFNTSNGRFTAPIAGRYWFFWHLLTDRNTGTGEGYIDLYKNGSYLYRNYETKESAVNAHMEYKGGMIVNMAANEYVYLYYQAAVGGALIVVSYQHCKFNGYLIG